jgi:hypothetical protein
MNRFHNLFICLQNAARYLERREIKCVGKCTLRSTLYYVGYHIPLYTKQAYISVFYLQVYLTEVPSYKIHLKGI